EALADEVALDLEPPVHVPVDAEGPGALAVAQDVRGPNAPRRAADVLRRGVDDSLVAGGDLDGAVPLPASADFAARLDSARFPLARDHPAAGHVEPAVDSIRQRVAEEALVRSFLGDVDELAAQRERPRRPAQLGPQPQAVSIDEGTQKVMLLGIGPAA